MIFEANKNLSMKPLLSIALLLFTGTVSAQTDSTKAAKLPADSLFKVMPAEGEGNEFYKMSDTTGMGQYGMRIYNPRTLRYLPVDNSSTENNPYEFTKKPAAVVKKKPVKKGKAGK
jgi:hypothetical protein